jgi:hypothetical protein
LARPTGIFGTLALTLKGRRRFATTFCASFRWLVEPVSPVRFLSVDS